MKKISVNLLAIFALLLPFKGNCQTNYSYQALPAMYSSKVKNDYNFNSFSGAFNLVKVLPKGYSKNGNVDYTDVIQAALDANRVVIFPNFPILVSEKGLKVSSNSTLLFGPNSKLIMTPNALDSYAILRIASVENVNVYYAVLEGERSKHTGKITGQWGHGISINNATNVKIINPRISQCWGDGIYVGLDKRIASKNITIENPVLDMNRRNGISVTDVNGLKIINPIISNTNGHSPECGIDIEPNTNKDTIDNISIENPVTYNNAKYGIVLSLGKLVGPVSKNVNININNHIDDGSYGGFAVNTIRGYFDKSPFTGTINVESSVWKNNRHQPFYYTKQILNRNLKMNNFKIVSKDKQGREYNDDKRIKAALDKLSNN